MVADGSAFLDSIQTEEGSWENDYCSQNPWECGLPPQEALVQPSGPFAGDVRPTCSQKMATAKQVIIDAVGVWGMAEAALSAHYGGAIALTTLGVGVSTVALYASAAVAIGGVALFAYCVLANQEAFSFAPCPEERFRFLMDDEFSAVWEY